MNNLTLMPPESHVVLKADALTEPVRIDIFLTQQFPAYSRNFFQKLIDQYSVLINNNIIKKTSAEVRPGDTVEVTFPPAELAPGLPLPDTDLGVQVLYEHPQFLVVYKPAGLTVHVTPHASTQVTLVDWLLHHFKDIKTVGTQDRPGIVHRLDKDTSGLLIIPRNNYSHALFSDLFKHRNISKTYLAIVKGHPPAQGSIDFAITRDPALKHKMTHKHPWGRESLTHYTVLEYFKDSALVHVEPVTGRTHQIRVHFAAMGHPILGDSVYGTSSKLISRQSLHAYRLSFTFNSILYVFWWSMPWDMQNLVNILRKQT